MMELGDLIYWWQAYWYNWGSTIMLSVVFCVIWLVLFAALRWIFKDQHKLIKKVLIPVLVIGLLAIPFLGRFHEEVAFRKACAEEAGLFVYQQIELGPEYWKKLDASRKSIIDSNYLVPKYGVELREELFNELYRFDYGPFKEGLIKGWLNAVRSENGQDTYIEVKTFYGGATGFLSQRSRQCGDLLDEYKELPTTPIKLVEYLYIESERNKGTRK